MTSYARIALLSMVVAAAGCKGCNAKKSAAAAITLSFSTPTNGATVDRSNDVDSSLDGIQIDVRVAAQNAPDATPVVLDILGPSGASGEITTLVASGLAIYPGVTLPTGQVTLTASAQGAAQPASIAISVLEQGAECDFVTPRDGDMLTSTDDEDTTDPGFQTQVIVSCVGIASGTIIEVGVKGRRLSSVPIDGQGRATVDHMDLAEGPNTLIIQAKQLQTDTEITVTVDTGHCLAELDPADGTLFLYDPMTDGALGTLDATRALTFSTSCAAGSVVTIDISGSLFDTTAPSGCQASKDLRVTATVGASGIATFDMAPLDQGNNIVGASVVEPDGIRGGMALDNLYVVDTYPPRIVFVFPDTGLDFDIVDDDPGTPGFQVNVRGQAIGIEQDSVQSLHVIDGQGNTADYTTKAQLLNAADANCFNQQQTTAQFQWSDVPLVDGATELDFSISDAAGNIVTHTANVVIVTEQPLLSLAVLPSGPMPLTLQDDQDPITPGLQLGFVVAVQNVTNLNGRSGSIVFPSEQPTFFTFNANPQTVPVTFTDDATITGITASATLQNGRTIQSAAIGLTVDATLPFLEQLSPRDGDVEPQATSTIAVSVGLQSELTSRDVRLYAGGSSPFATATIPTGATAGDALSYTFTGVPLAAGPNVLRVEADDLPGPKKNTAVLTLNVYRASGPPSIVFTTVNGASGLAAAPTVNALGPSDFDGNVQNGFDLQIGAHITAVPGPALIDLYVTEAGGAPGPSSLWLSELRTVPTIGALDLSDLDFSIWAHDNIALWLQVTETLTGNSAPAPAQLDVNANPGPSGDAKVAIVSPPFGADSSALIYDVVIATDPGSKTCNLFIDGASAGVSPQGPFTGTGATFSSVPVSWSDGPHDFSVMCSDGAGLTYYSQRQLVNYKSSAPALAFVDEPGARLAAASGPYYFNAQAPDSDLAAGYQHDVTVSAGEPDGTLVTLSVNAAAAATGEIFGGQATFRNVTLSSNAAPSGETISLQAQLVDAFGFGTLAVSRAVLLDQTPPVIAFAAGDCPPVINRFNPYDNPPVYASVKWQAIYTTQGLNDGAIVTTHVTDLSGTNTITSTVAANGASGQIAFTVGTPESAYGGAFYGSATDAAGNVASSPVCAPTIDPTNAAVTFRTQRDAYVDGAIGNPPPQHTLLLADDLNPNVAGIQTSFIVTALNLSSGSAVHLCSTANDPALYNAAACTSVPGKILAGGTTATVSGGIGQVTFSDVNMIDSGPTPYGLAVEAIDPATLLTAVSPAQLAGPPSRVFLVIVDSSAPPAISSVTSQANIPSNDRTQPAVLVLGKNVWNGSSYAAEGDTSVTGKLDPQSITLTMSGPVAGIVATLHSDLQFLSPPPTLTASGNQLRFSAIGALIEGLHTMTVQMSTQNGNSGSATFSVFVDVTPPQISVGQPTAAPYVCPAPNGCHSPGGLTLGVDISVSDNFDLSGGCACARLATMVTCLNDPTLCGQGVTLGAGSAGVVTPTGALVEGSNALFGEAADAAGNAAITSIATVYNVDTLATVGAPVLDVSATPGTAASFASSLALAYDQGASACQDDYPSPGTDPGSGATPNCGRWYSSSVYRLTTQGTTSGACQITADTCTHSVRLLAMPLDGTVGTPLGAFEEVFLSSRTNLVADIAAATLIENVPTAAFEPPPGLDRAANWQLQLEARDRYGNTNLSPARFVDLPGFTGALVSVAHVTGGGGAVQPNGLFGVRHNKNGQALPYVTDVNVDLLWTTTPPGASGRCVHVNAAGTALYGVSNAVTAGAETVAFTNVTLPSPGATFTLLAEVSADNSCTPVHSVGAVTLGGLSTTVTLPTVVFDCAWRKAMGFNSDCTSAPSGPTTQVTGVAQTPLATPNLQDQNPTTPGFQFPQPVKVDVTDAGGGAVTLSSSLSTAPLSGTITHAVAGSGAQQVAFDSSVTVPTSMTPGNPATTNVHIISAQVCNAASDCVTTTSGSGVPSDTSLRLKANADAPNAVGTTTVCTGENQGSFPDAGACASLCGSSCDRRAGKAVISFSAPGADNGTVGNVAGYDVAVAILDDVPNGTPEQQCDTLVLTGASGYDKLFVTVAPPTIVAPGQQQTLAISGLPLHQRLCVAAMATDDVGNHGAPSSALRVNVLEPVSNVTPYTFDRQNGDRPSDNAFAMSELSFSVPLSAIAVGDMDGDGGVEIAISGFDTINNVGKVLIYSSRATQGGNFAPVEVITQNPFPTSFSSTQSFAIDLAGGDFNGDGLADIAIGAPYADAPSGVATNAGGAVYVYYGSGDATGARMIREVPNTSCPFTNTSGQPSCPHLSLYLSGPGTYLGWSVVAGNVTQTVAPTDGRKKTFTFPADLLIGSPTIGGPSLVYLVRTADSGAQSIFKNPVPPTTATAINLGGASSYVSVFSNSGGNLIGLEEMLSDLNGDGRQDVIIGLDGTFNGGPHVLYYYNATAVTASQSEATANRCDTYDDSSLLGLNLANIGRISGGNADWLAARKTTDKLQLVQGTPGGFFTDATCVDGTTRNDSYELYGVTPVADTLSSSPPLVAGALAPITRFGASLDDTCNAEKNTQLNAADLFGSENGVAALGDFNGDGLDDFVVGQSGAPPPSGATTSSRAYVLSYQAPVCNPNGNKFKVLLEVTGNLTTSGPGIFAFGAWSHAGGNYPALGLAGTQGATGSGLWIFR